MKKTFLALLACICASSAHSQTTDYSATIIQTSALIKSKMNSCSISGLSITLVDDQRKVWTTGFGYADVDNMVAVTDTTVFELGPLCKTFTAAAVMKQVDDGQVDIDQPLTTYLPDFSIIQRFPSSGPITPRALMSSRAGVPSDFPNGTFTVSDYPAYTPWMLAYLKTQSTAFPVDQVAVESNVGFQLLSCAVAEVSGKTFPQFVADNFFTPMGMASSNYTLDNSSTASGGPLAKSYYETVKLQNFYCNIKGASGGYSCAADMANYLQMLNADGQYDGKRILSAASLAEMLTVQNPDSGLDGDKQVGLGWNLNDPYFDYAGKSCFRGANTIGYSGHIELLLDHKLAVVVLCNGIANDATNAVRDIARTTLMYALIDKASLPKPDPPVVVTPAINYSFPKDELTALSGNYVTNTGYELMTVYNKGLLVRSYQGSTITERQLMPREDGLFSLPDPDYLVYRARFATIDGIQVFFRVYSDGTEERIGAKFTPGTIPATWIARSGTYAATNVLDSDCENYLPSAAQPISQRLTLKVENGMLVITLSNGGRRFVLEPSGDDLAYVQGLSRNQGETVAFTHAGSTNILSLLGLDYVSYQVLNVKKISASLHYPAAKNDVFLLSGGWWPEDGGAPESIVLNIDNWHGQFTGFKNVNGVYKASTSDDNGSYNFTYYSNSKRWAFATRNSNFLDQLNLFNSEISVSYILNGVVYGNTFAMNEKNDWSFSSARQEQSEIPGDYTDHVGNISGHYAKGSKSRFNITNCNADASAALATQIALTAAVYVNIGDQTFPVPLYRKNPVQEIYQYKTRSQKVNTQAKITMNMRLNKNTGLYKWDFQINSASLTRIGGPQLNLVLKIGDYYSGVQLNTKQHVQLSY